MDAAKIHNAIIFFIMNKLTICYERRIENLKFNSYDDWYTNCITTLEERLKYIPTSNEEDKQYDYITELIYDVYPIMISFDDDVSSLVDFILPVVVPSLL